jgi:hypothetical protein
MRGSEKHIDLMLKFYAAGGYGRPSFGDADPRVLPGAYPVQINLLTPRPEWPALERPKQTADHGPLPPMAPRGALPTAKTIPKVVTR